MIYSNANSDSEFTLDYNRIKDEVKQIVKDELERIASDESLKHLLQSK